MAQQQPKATDTLAPAATVAGRGEHCSKKTTRGLAVGGYRHTHFPALVR
jgi:hypothetical protein